MTCAHRCLLNQLRDLLDQLDADEALHLRRGPCPTGALGEVDFDRNEVVISDAATKAEFRTALAHELVHLLRGPAYADEEDTEEVVVHETAARLLVPRDHLPAILDAADPHAVAADLAIDLHTAELGIALHATDERQAVLDEGAA